MDSKGSCGLSPGDDRPRQGNLFKVGKSKPRRFGVKEVREPRHTCVGYLAHPFRNSRICMSTKLV
jgi:hypothetical protein